jgi:GTPase Era involved in 16S rRNA processing
MPKAIIEFKLPEEREEFELATNARKWMSFAHSFSEYLRQETKYNDDAYTEDQYKVLEQVREKFYHLLQEENLSL